MKTALKRKKDEFLVMPLKHVFSVMGLVNHPEIPKLWAIAHENDPKTKKRRVFGHATQTCTNIMGPVNHPGTPNMWATGHKKQP
jgi:hypothetical protein